MKSSSLDPRRRVLADWDAGLGTKAAAQKFSVSPARVRRLKQRRREGGSIDRRPPSPGRPVKLAPHDQRVRDLVREDPDATPNELRARLGVAVSVAALHAFLRRIGLSFKKTRPASFA